MDQVHVKRTLSLGKYRGLQRASTPEGYFTILAMDHHDILRRALNPSAPETVTDEQMAAFKGQVVHAFAPETSGVLLDPVYGAAQAVSGAYLNGAGLLVEMEKTGYKLKPLPLECELLPGWSVAKIKRMGADGVKLFFYYNPDGGALVAKHDTLLRQIVADCAVHDIPLYAEPIICAIGEDDVTYTQKFSQRVIDSARRVAALGADVLKLEFPLPPEVLDDELLCHDWCAQLTAELDIPAGRNRLFSGRIGVYRRARLVGRGCPDRR
jgi:tagatose 1,6-diphosphate aldolase